MLSIKELVIKNNQQGLTLVDHLSFTLNNNDKIAIIGSEGSGKSTLLSVIFGNDIAYISYSGKIVRPGVISYLEQNVVANWGETTVEAFFEDEIKRRNQESLYQVIPKIASDFSLDYQTIRHRKIKTFSGGEIVKIGLIKALMITPDVLLLDEPSNDIDFKTLLFLEGFLINTQIPILFVSHDQRLLENVSNGIIHLQHIHKKSKPKTTFIRMGYQAYKTHQANQFTSSLMIARKQRSDYQKRIEKFNRIYQTVEHQQNQAVRNPELGRLLKKKMKSLKSQEKRFVKEKDEFIQIPEREEPMHLFFDETTKINTQKQILNLDLKDFKLKNGHQIKHVKLSLRGTDKVVIIGDNGVGKTTLIEYMIEVFKKEQTKFGYISQNYMNVLEPNLNGVDFLLKHQNKHQEARIRQILGTLGLKKDEMIYPIKSLSEGTKLKVLLLLLVCQDVEVLVLDEPTRNISPLNQDELYTLFSSFKGSIIAVTHDRAFMEAVFDDIYELTKETLKKL